jgi:hypothetical protein
MSAPVLQLASLTLFENVLQVPYAAALVHKPKEAASSHCPWQELHAYRSTSNKWRQMENITAKAEHFQVLSP